MVNYKPKKWLPLLLAVLLLLSIFAPGIQTAVGTETANKPFDVVATINGNPKTQMGFAWFTNPGTGTSKLQIIRGGQKTAADFQHPFALREYPETKTAIVDANYTSTADKRSYESHKALATGLRPNATYSYRVGNNRDGWSEIGSFTTAVNGDTPFSFIYLTDTQAKNSNQFTISANTIHQAYAKVPDAKFLLEPGDLIESSTGLEWEWNQYFSTNQDLWYKLPLVPAIGNHDNNANNNFSNHFNTAALPNGMTAAKPGTVYSFEYGNALFMVLNYEVYHSPSDLEAMAKWMKAVTRQSNKKWKIAVFHKAMYTGSGSHQSDADARTIRNTFAPLFDELHIDLAIQGHDHIYEVIGPVRNSQLVPGAVSGVTADTAVDPNGNGKKGGAFDVTNGTLYFLNGAAGSKFYYPRTEAQMAAAEPETGIANYYSLFTGKFDQAKKQTFSQVTVKDSEITLDTYLVDTATGKLVSDTPWDSIKVVKQSPQQLLRDTVTVVQKMEMNRVLKRQLTFDLSKAQFMVAIGLKGQAIKTLNNFIKEVNQAAAKKMLTQEQSDQLVAAANQIIGLLK